MSSKFSKLALPVASALLSWSLSCSDIATKADKQLTYIESSQYNANNPIEDRIAYG